MRTHLSFRATLAAAAMLATAAVAAQAQTIDQGTSASFSAFSNSRNWTGQTFRPSAATVAGAGVNLFSYYPNAPVETGTVAVQLWTDAPSTAGATMLAGGTATFSLAGREATFTDVFWTAVAVTPGDQYFLAFKSTYLGGYELEFSYTGDSYTAGNAFYNNSNVQSDPWYGYGYELSFREYSSAAAVVTPEPTSLTLFVIGLVGVGAAGRVRTRRRAATHQHAG